MRHFFSAPHFTSEARPPGSSVRKMLNRTKIGAHVIFLLILPMLEGSTHAL